MFIAPRKNVEHFVRRVSSSPAGQSNPSTFCNCAHTSACSLVLRPCQREGSVALSTGVHRYCTVHSTLRECPCCPRGQRTCGPKRPSFHSNARVEGHISSLAAPLCPPRRCSRSVLFQFMSPCELARCGDPVMASDNDTQVRVIDTPGIPGIQVVRQATAKPPDRVSFGRDHGTGAPPFELGTNAKSRLGAPQQR